MNEGIHFEYCERTDHLSIVCPADEDRPLAHLENRWSLRDAELIREEIEKAMSDGMLKDFCIEDLTGFLRVFPDSGEGLFSAVPYTSKSLRLF